MRLRKKETTRALRVLLSSADTALRLFLLRRESGIRVERDIGNLGVDGVSVPDVADEETVFIRIDNGGIRRSRQSFSDERHGPLRPHL